MDKYRVIVLREDDEADETLFEIAGSAALVGRLVPGALIEALEADDERDAATSPAAPAVNVADRVFDGAVTAGAAAEAQQSGEPVKRARRTKAQIAADKEAQGLGFRDAAHRAEVEAHDAEPRLPSPVSGFVRPAGEQVVASIPGPIVTEASDDAPPWSPFT